MGVYTRNTHKWERNTMAETANGSKAGVSKMEAVRQGLQQLGRNAKPLKLQAFIKEKFNIDMTPDHISNYKSTILKSKGKPGRKPGTKTDPAAPAAASMKPAGNAYGRGGLSPDDVENVKTLVHRFGPTSLKKLIDVLVQ
jgi:hypothetical protein